MLMVCMVCVIGHVMCGVVGCGLCCRRVECVLLVGAMGTVGWYDEH